VNEVGQLVSAVQETQQHKVPNN